MEYSSKTEKIYTDLMFMLGLNETMDLLAIANSVRWYGHVLRRALEFEVEGQKTRREAEEDMEKVGRKSECWLEKERCTLPFKVELRR